MSHIDGLLSIQVFYDAVSPGSWLMDVLGAGHATFFRSPWLLQKVLDLLCHKGIESHKVSWTQCTAAAISLICLASWQLSLMPPACLFAAHCHTRATGRVPCILQLAQALQSFSLQQEAIESAARLMLAWFDRHLRSSPMQTQRRCLSVFPLRWTQHCFHNMCICSGACSSSVC